MGPNVRIAPVTALLAATLATLATIRPTTAGQSLAPGSAAPALLTTIVLKPKTRVVNVYENQTVTFAFGGKSFRVTFDGTKTAYDLGSLAPPGTVLPHKIRVYVAPNPTQHQQGIP